MSVLAWSAIVEGTGSGSISQSWTDFFKRNGSGASEIFVPLVVVTTALVIWAYFFRKRGRQGHHRYHRHHRPFPQPPTPDAATGKAKGKFSLFSRPRQRRRRWKRSNPTLAATGGLPPIRPTELESPPPPG